MTQTSVWGTFHKFNLRGLLGLYPLRSDHHFFRYRVLVLAFLFRQVHERNFVRFEVLQGFKDFRAVELIKTSNQAFDVVQLPIAVFPNQQLVHPSVPGDVTADEKLVFLIEALFHPPI